MTELCNDVDMIFLDVNIVNDIRVCYTMPRQEMRLVSKLAQSETPRMAVRGVSFRLIATVISV